MAIRIGEKLEGQPNESESDRMKELKTSDNCNLKDNPECDDAYQDGFDRKMEISEEIKASFKDGNYRIVEAGEDITLYRVYGKGAGKQGGFLTTEKPEDRMEAKLELALKDTWKNSREYYSEVKVPKGTLMAVGKAAKQETSGGQVLTGGAEQVFVDYAFVSDPENYGQEYDLNFAGNYHEFEAKVSEIEKTQK